MNYRLSCYHLEIISTMHFSVSCSQSWHCPHSLTVATIGLAGSDDAKIRWSEKSTPVCSSVQQFATTAEWQSSVFLFWWQWLTVSGSKTQDWSYHTLVGLFVLCCFQLQLLSQRTRNIWTIINRWEILCCLICKSLDLLHFSFNWRFSCRRRHHYHGLNRRERMLHLMEINGLPMFLVRQTLLRSDIT